MSISDKVLQYRKEFTSYVNELRENSDADKIVELAEMRNIDVQVLRDAGIFYIADQAEMILPEYFDKLRDFGVIAVNNKPIYNERWVIPIHDAKGYVMSLVGYKPGVQERYMYSTTKYFIRGDALYGLENLSDCINYGAVVVVEGIMDALRVRSFGTKYVIGTCGADKSWDRMLAFNGISKCLFIPDQDRAGSLTKDHWVSKTSLRLEIPKPFKDIDEFARQNETTLSFCKDMVLGYLQYLKEEVPEGYRGNICVSKELGV